MVFVGDVARRVACSLRLLGSSSLREKKVVQKAVLRPVQIALQKRSVAVSGKHFAIGKRYSVSACYLCAACA